MNQKSKQFIGITIIFIALYLILFSGSPQFSSEEAEHILTDISEHVAAEALSRNQEARLQYSNVDIHGFAYEKQATITNLSLDWMIQRWHGPSHFSISTTSAELSPDRIAHDQRSIFTFRDVINIVSSSELLARIYPAQPISYTFDNNSTSEDLLTKHYVSLPTNLHITLPESKMDVAVSSKSPSVLKMFLSNSAQRRMHAELMSGGLRVSSNEHVVTAHDANLRYDAINKTPNITESKGSITLNQLAFKHSQNIHTSPYALTAAWTSKEVRNISGATDSVVLTIDQGLLSDGTLRIATDGMLQFDIDDVMYGELTVEINNAVALINSSLIAEDKRGLALSLINDIMGNDESERKQTIITISRPKNGEWMVGKTPLSSLVDKGLWSIFIFSE